MFLLCFKVIGMPETGDQHAEMGDRDQPKWVIAMFRNG